MSHDDEYERFLFEARSEVDPQFPMTTDLLYRVCQCHQSRFDAAERMLRRAFDAGLHVGQSEAFGRPVPPGVRVDHGSGPRWDILVSGRTDVVAVVPVDGWRGWWRRLLGRPNGWRVILVPTDPPRHIN